LSKQKWFHGLLTREESDSLLCENGQFFVRNSPSNPNRFVLVGMHNGKVVHIRLLNNEEKVWKKFFFIFFGKIKLRKIDVN